MPSLGYLPDPGIELKSPTLQADFYQPSYQGSPLEENQEELKSFLMQVKEKSEKAGLKLKTQNSKIMASGPTTSWQIDGERWKQ